MVNFDKDFPGRILDNNFRLLNIGDFTHLSLSAHDGFILSRVEGKIDGRQLLALTGVTNEILIDSLARMVSFGLLTSGDEEIDKVLKLFADEKKVRSAVEKTEPTAEDGAGHTFDFAEPSDVAEGDDAADFFSPPDEEEPEQASRKPVATQNEATDETEPDVAAAPVAPRLSRKKIAVDLDAIPDWQDPPAQGKLKSNPVARLIDFIIRSKQAGILSLEREGVHKRLSFLAGRLLNVESISIIEEECLGQILKQFGKISPEQLEESRRRMEAEDRKQGEILVEMGLITPNLLLGALKKQVEIKFCEIYEWEDGLYSFEKRCDFSYHDFDFNLPKLNYKMALERTDHELARLELQPYLDRFIYSKDDDPFYAKVELPLDKKAHIYLQELNGTRTLRNSIAYSPVSKLATFRLLYAFQLAKLIEFKESKSIAEQQAKLEYEFERELNYVKTKDYFEILEIHWSVRPYEIDNSYKRLKGQYTLAESDKLATPKLLKLSREIMEYIEQAYSIISDETKRVYYRKEFLGETRMKMSAELQFKKGENFLFWKEDFDAAVYHLESAVDLAPGNADYLATLALATVVKHRSDQVKVREGFSMIERAHRMRKNNPVAYLCQGLMLFHTGKRGQAVEKLQTALKLDPDYPEAKRGLRLVAGG